MKYLTIILFAALFAACMPEAQEGPEEMEFFPLKDYFEKEMARLRNEKVTIEKIVIIEGKEEKQTFDKVNWSGELAAFVNADINKPALRAAYKTVHDTLADDMVILTHTAQKEAPVTRLVKVIKKKGSVEKIEIETRDDNVVYGSGQKLIYIPDSGYTIQAMQDVMLADKKHFFVEVKYIK